MVREEDLKRMLATGIDLSDETEIYHIEHDFVRRKYHLFVRHPEIERPFDDCLTAGWGGIKEIWPFLFKEKKGKKGGKEG